MRKSLFFFLYIVLLLSCKKNMTSVPVDKRQYFKNAYLTHFDNFKIYTKTGEVANSALAQTYANEFDHYFFNTTSSFTDPDLQKFIFVNDDSIINISSNVPVIVKRKNIDTYDKFSSNSTDIVNDTNAINWHIIKYKLLQQKTSSGFIYHEIERPVYFLKRINDTLFFPIVRYIIISRRPFITFFSADKFNNVFSADGVNKLEPHDTLVVQSFDLAMKKIE